MAKTILVIEDEEQYRNTLRKYLEHVGFTIHTAVPVLLDDDGWFAAGQLCNLNRYDLIIADNQLGKNRSHWGIHLIPRLKRVQKQAKTILMSSEQVEVHPADRFFLKAEGLGTLHKMITDLIGK